MNKRKREREKGKIERASQLTYCSFRGTEYEYICPKGGISGLLHQVCREKDKAHTEHSAYLLCTQKGSPEGRL